MSKIKKLEDWKKSNAKSFDDFFKAGDIVGEDVVNYFSDIVPPITFYDDFIQIGEPYDEKIDFEDNKWKNIYATFEKEGKYWIYKGNCFRNKNVDQTYTPKPSYMERIERKEEEEGFE